MGCVLSRSFVTGPASSSSTIAPRKTNSNNCALERPEVAIESGDRGGSQPASSLTAKVAAADGNCSEGVVGTGRSDWLGISKENGLPKVEHTLGLPSCGTSSQIQKGTPDLNEAGISNSMLPTRSTTPSSAAFGIGSAPPLFLPPLIRSPASGSLVSPTRRRLGSGSMASASADLNVMLLPQLPQALHQSSMSFTRSADLYPTQESLSDISAALSIVSTPMHTSHHSSSISCACSSEGPCGFMSRTFCKDENSKAQQLQASVQMETDLFIYDDIVISKNEARIKHWHLAGRKPRSANTELGRDNETSECSGYGKRMNGVGHRFFSFNDFDVCVDEMDIIPMSGTTAGSASTPHREASPVGSPNENLRCITVTSTVAERPNTVAHFLEQCRLAQPKANRPLRGFHTSPYLGHATRIKCLALSPSETDLVSCSNEDASVTLKNLQLNSEVGIFTGHQDAVINAIFSSDGKYLATASKDKTMILWDVMTAKRLLTFAHPKVVICCCFSPDSKYIMSGCQDRVCRLWDTKRGREWLRYAGHKGIIIAMAFSPNGNDLCSASADKSLRVWSTTTAKTRLQLIGHVGIVLSCSYTSDGQYIISNDESVLRVWSAEDGSCTLSVSPLDVAGYTRLHHRVPRLSWTLSSAAPGSFTQLIVVACNNHFVYLLDIRTGREVTSFFCKASVYCLTVGSYEKVACGDSFGNIYMLSLL